MTTTAVTPPAGAAAGTPSTNLKDTPEFKEALKQAREEERVQLEAEYRRKRQELEGTQSGSSTPPPTNGRDYFDEWGERHGVSPEAGRDLAVTVIQHITGTVLPKELRPLRQSDKRNELRTQRNELRGTNPKLAKLDSRFHPEVMKLLDPIDPQLITPESYARALNMVIGANIEKLDEERGQAAAEPIERQAETVPGPEPLPSSTGSAKPSKIVLNAKQQAFCDDKGFSAEEFAEIMRDRARKLENGGKSKVQIRAQLGDLLGSIEW